MSTSTSEAPRIRGLEQHEAPLVARPLYGKVKKMFGKVITPIKVQARRPGILWLSSLLGLAIEKSGLIPHRLHLLVELRSAQCIGCPF